MLLDCARCDIPITWALVGLPRLQHRCNGVSDFVVGLRSPPQLLGEAGELFAGDGHHHLARLDPGADPVRDATEAHSHTTLVVGHRYRSAGGRAHQPRSTRGCPHEHRLLGVADHKHHVRFETYLVKRAVRHEIWSLAHPRDSAKLRGGEVAGLVEEGNIHTSVKRHLLWRQETVSEAADVAVRVVLLVGIEGILEASYPEDASGGNALFVFLRSPRRRVHERNRHWRVLEAQELHQLRTNRLVLPQVHWVFDYERGLFKMGSYRSVTGQPSSFAQNWNRHGWLSAGRETIRPDRGSRRRNHRLRSRPLLQESCSNTYSIQVPVVYEYLVETFVPTSGISTPEFIRFFTVPVPFACSVGIGFVMLRSRSEAKTVTLPET